MNRLQGKIMSLLPELWREINPRLSLQDLQNLRLSSHFLYNCVTESLYCRYGDRILLRSAEEGYTETVKKMLCIADPSYENNAAIRLASENGHVEIVKLLLEDDRVDASADNNYAVIYASMNGHVAVVDLLTRPGHVSASILDNIPLCIASLYGYMEMVKLLVPRSSSLSLAIHNAEGSGHIEIMNYLKNPILL